MNQSPSERRKYKRFTRHFILTYFDTADRKNRYDASQLKNISLGGICLITAQAFAPATRLGIELKTPYLAQAIHLEGVVVESTEKINNMIYETRLKFLNLSPEAQTVLKKLVDHFEIEKSKDYE